MPNIDNLNFKVIIDDAQFNQKIEAMKTTAKQFNTSLSNLLNVQSVSQEIVLNNRKRNQMETDNVRAIERQNREKIRSEALQKKLNAQIDKTTKSYQYQSKILQEMKGFALGYLSVQGTTQLLSSLIRVTGEFELQKTTLAAMLGDLNQAEMIITKIKGLAIESPFQFKELTTYAKQLSAFAVPAEELYDTTKMLADVSAGLGVGMDRLVLAYGQVRSAAFLRGQEVRQFTEAGIPILNELAKQFEELEGRAVSAGEVFDKISARLVPFEMVAKVFRDMTSEGGKFYNMQEIQAETLKGKYENLKDAIEQTINAIGESQSDKLKGVLDWSRELVQNYEETGKVLLELIASYGVYKATLLAVEIATKSFEVANHRMIGSLVSAARFLASNPYVILAAGLTAAGYALYKNHTELEGFQKIQKSVLDVQNDFTKELSKETMKLDSLYAKLRLAKEGTEEYNDAKKQIYTQFASYISELKAEGVEVSNLTDIYDKLKIKVEEATRARTSAKAEQKLSETFDQEVDNIYDRYIKIITKARRQLNRGAKDGYKEFNEFEKAGFWKFITGSMNMGDLERTSGLERVVNVLNNASLDASADLKLLRKEMLMTTKEYSKSLGEIKKAYGEIEASGATIIPPLAGAGDNDAAIKAIQDEIRVLHTLKKEYDDWKALGLSDEAISLSLQGFFPNIKAEYGESYITQLNFATRILQKIKELERLAPEEAFDLMTSFGTDKSAQEKDALKQLEKAYKDTAKAAGDYFEAIRKWSSEDFNISGEGIVLDVSKIASDLNQKFNEIDLRTKKTKELFNQIGISDTSRPSVEAISKIKVEFEKEFGEGSWDVFYDEYMSEGEAAIARLAEKQKQYERKLAQERVNDLAEKFVKESYFKGNIELTDLSDKNFMQIRAIRKKLQDLIDKEPLQVPVEIQQSLLADGIDVNALVDKDLSEYFERMEIDGTPIDESTKSMLILIQSIQKAQLSTKAFGDTVKKVFQGDLKNLTEEQAKALSEMIKSYMEEIGGLFQTIGEYAEVIGDDGLLGAINGISESMDILGSVAEKLAKQDWVGAIISGVTSLANTVINALTAQEELNKAIAETRNELRLLASQNAIKENVESIFGTDEYKQFANAYEEAVKAHKKALEDIEQQNLAFEGRSKDNWGAAGLLGAIGAGAATGAGVGALAGGWFGGITIAAGAVIGGIVGLITGLTGVVATAANDYALTLQQMASTIGADLINDETGTFSSEALKSIKETYSDLDDEYKDMLDKLITNAEIFENAITEMASYMTDIFGQCASDMADSFVEAFKQSGEAALDYEDTLDEVATNIAKSIIKSTILQNVFDEEDAKQAATLLASGNTAGALATVEQAMEAAKELTPSIQAFLESLQPYFKMEDMESATLGNGIKGITEDTANLLASYLNAIRADVSYSKTIWERMDQTTQQIASMLSSVPNLMEYQAQIAANTFNTAMATQDILSELRGVISSDGGYTGIRTIG